MIHEALLIEQAQEEDEEQTKGLARVVYSLAGGVSPAAVSVRVNVDTIIAFSCYYSNITTVIVKSDK